MPIAFFCAGIAFYIYYGIEWNAWIHNLPNLGIYALICAALGWALYKKAQLKEERENNL